MELGKAGTDDWYKQNFWGLCGWCTTFFCGGGAWFLIDAQSRWISWNNKGYGSETAAKYGPKDCIWMGLAVFWGSSTRWKGKMGSFWDPERIPKVRFFKKKSQILKKELRFYLIISWRTESFQVRHYMTEADNRMWVRVLFLSKGFVLLQRGHSGCRR